MGSSVHLVHLLVDDGEDRVGLELHRSGRHHTRLHRARRPRPLVIGLSFCACASVVASVVMVVGGLDEAACVGLLGGIGRVLVEDYRGFLL